MEIRLNDWILEVDFDRTSKFYNDMDDEIQCDCLSCQNYRLYLKKNNGVRSFFQQLGIDPFKDGDYTSYGVPENGRLLYLGVYHIVGVIVSGPTVITDMWSNVNLTKVEDFNIGFSYELRCVDPDFPEPIIQLEFEANLPWLLDKEWAE
ncbi:hypothetical protein SD71_15335 [Cohnella kolymensis]|uniref:Uncharacterized protein n=1 Tax=Cohnella kolymensis TaxID=1590652 RepID=A0ABR5A3B8_9BACL|nr:hypothetical protein [Cohnella kolymensis]KIL35035.1 hypothetical protein SD71_15335 [Cohnella kolymensis]